MSRSVVSNSLQPHGPYSPWNSLGQNTGVGSLSLLQGIFSIQGLNPGLPNCRRILYQVSHKESPRISEWVAYPFSSRSSDPGIELGSPALQVDSLPTELSGKPVSRASQKAIYGILTSGQKKLTPGLIKCNRSSQCLTTTPSRV